MNRGLLTVDCKYHSSAHQRRHFATPRSRCMYSTAISQLPPGFHWSDMPPSSGHIWLVTIIVANACDRAGTHRTRYNVSLQQATFKRIKGTILDMSDIRGAICTTTPDTLIVPSGIETPFRTGQSGLLSSDAAVIAFHVGVLEERYQHSLACIANLDWESFQEKSNIAIISVELGILRLFQLMKLTGITGRESISSRTIQLPSMSLKSRWNGTR
jgi:hypothetical protein